MSAYTEFIENGTVTTGKDFLKLCSRNFGIYETSKDEALSVDIPVTITKAASFQAAVDEAKSTLDEALHQTDWEQVLSDKISVLTAEIETINTHKTNLAEIYNTINSEIIAYKPNDPYGKIKNFALSQIKLGLNAIPNSDAKEAELAKLQTYTADKYKDVLIKELSEKLAEKILDNQKEDANIAKRQDYLDKFWESISGL